MPPPKTRRTQAERTAASDKAMFRAAIKVIAREGIDSLTLTKLGKEAGFSGALVSYRYGTKSNMLKATAQRAIEEWEQRIYRPGIEEPGIEGMRKAAKIYLDAIRAKSDLMVAQYWLMHGSYSSHRELQPIFRAFHTGTRETVVRWLQAAEDKGEIRAGVDKEGFAVVFIGMMRGIALQYFVDPKAIDLDHAYDMVLQTIDSLLVN